MRPDAVTIGVDVGTSGVRAVALNRHFTPVAKGEAAMGTEAGALRNPALWWGATETALDALFRTVDPRRVVAIAVDGTSGTVLAVDGQGEPLAPALLYNDSVPDVAILDRITREAPPQSGAHGPTSGLAKLLVLEATCRPARILHQADWIAGRLCGRFDVSDENNALKTGYDPVARTWPDWIERTGADTRLLPTVVPPGSRLAPITGATADRFGLPAATLIVSGTTDGCASYLATGAAEVGEAVTALGSTLVVKLLCDKPLFAPEYGLYSHRLGETWLAGGASNTGGAVLAAYFEPTRLDELSAAIDPTIETGLDYYPLLKPGERFPVNDPTLKPRVEPRPESDARFLQGLLEGMASIEALAYQRLASVGGPKTVSVRTVGGGAKNRAWTQIRERRLGMPLTPAASEDAALGTARLAWQGIMA
jgi:D-ribulokinase